MTPHAEQILEYLSNSFWKVKQEFDHDLIQNVWTAAPPGGMPIKILPLSEHCTALVANAILLRGPDDLNLNTFLEKVGSHLGVIGLAFLEEDDTMYRFQLRAVYCGLFDAVALKEFLIMFTDEYDRIFMLSIPPLQDDIDG